jgi:hypothetical protein
MTETTNIWLVRLSFVGMVCVVIGAALGYYGATFIIPSCKIWESNRSYDHILIADDVICKPMNEHNTTYYHYEVAHYNNTDYIVQKIQVSNATAKGMIVCR